MNRALVANILRIKAARYFQKMYLTRRSLQQAVPIIVIISMSTLPLGGCSEIHLTVRTSPNFQTRLASIKTAAIMPIKVKMYRMSVTSRAGEGDAIPEASAKARQNLALALRKQFISMRLLSPESSPASFHAANWAELDDTLALYQAVNASIISFYKEEFDLSLGPSIKAFAENAKVDALIFVYAESAVPTAGMVTLQVLSMVPNYAGPIMLGSTKVGIAIVDGMNGDLLWHVSNQGTQIFPSDFEACAQACTHLVALMLKDFPKLKIVEP